MTLDFYGDKKVIKMTSVNDEKSTDALEKWLSHFKTFETYIEFFCFQDFVSGSRNVQFLRKRNTFFFQREDILLP